MIAGEVAEVAELAEVVEVVEVVELAGAAEARLEASSDRRRRILDLRWIFVSLDLRSPRCKGRRVKAPIFLTREHVRVLVERIFRVDLQITRNV